MKWRLFGFASAEEKLLHKGGFERVTDYSKAIEDCLLQLKQEGHIQQEGDLAAVGFKTIMARGVNGCVRLEESVLKAMEADAGIDIKELRVDGGATVNNALMQFQCDILHCKVVRPRITETTALGAAYLAGLAVGYWKNIEEIQQHWQIDKTFSPKMETSKANELLDGWQRAVKASIAWAGL